MDEIQKTVQAFERRAQHPDFFEIARVTHKQPLFSNDLLDFWCPIATIESNESCYDIGLCRVKKRFSYFERMERHRYSVEIIAPIDGVLFIPVAPPGETIDPEEIELIQVKVGEIITLKKGVWHFACGFMSSPPLDYFVLLKSNTPEDDLEMGGLEKRITIVE